MAPYYNVDARTLYQSVISASWDFSQHDDPFTKAKAWVEAENVVEVWELVQKWFEMMQDDTAQLQFPDPFWDNGDFPLLTPLTQELVDELIEELDADFELERNRFQGRGAPDFKRLVPHARMAFAQAIYRIALSDKEISAKAERLVEAGTPIPPPIPKTP